MTEPLQRKPSTRWERLVFLLGRADLDHADGCVLVGLVLLVVGLWAWIGFGVAVTVVGALVFAIGVVGARGPAPATGTTTGG
jgi:hypothetical protein